MRGRSQYKDVVLPVLGFHVKDNAFLFIMEITSYPEIPSLYWDGAQKMRQLGDCLILMMGVPVLVWLHLCTFASSLSYYNSFENWVKRVVTSLRVNNHSIGQSGDIPHCVHSCTITRCPNTFYTVPLTFSFKLFYKWSVHLNRLI